MARGSIKRLSRKLQSLHRRLNKRGGKWRASKVRRIRGRISRYAKKLSDKKAVKKLRSGRNPRAPKEWKLVRRVLAGRIDASAAFNELVPQTDNPTDYVIFNQMFSWPMQLPEQGTSHYQRIGRRIGKCVYHIKGIFQLTPAIVNRLDQYAFQGEPDFRTATTFNTPISCTVRIIAYRVKGGLTTARYYSDATYHTMRQPDGLNPTLHTLQSVLGSMPNTSVTNTPNPNVLITPSGGLSPNISTHWAPQPQTMDLITSPFRLGITHKASILADRKIYIATNQGAAHRKINMKLRLGTIEWIENATGADDTNTAPLIPDQVFVLIIPVFNTYIVDAVQNTIHSYPRLKYNLTTDLVYSDL